MDKLVILHIDIVSDYDLIRPAEKAIFGKEFEKLGVPVFFFLVGSNRRDNNKIYYRKVVSFKRVRIEFEFWFKLVKVIRKHSINLLQVRNDVNAGIMAYFVAKVLGLKFVFLRSFPSEDHALEIAGLGKMKFAALRVPLFKLKKRVAIFLMNRSDCVIAKSKAFKKTLFDEGMTNPNTIHIPMGFDLDAPSNIKDCSSGEKLEKGKKYVMYFGAMDRPRNLAFLLRVFRRCLKMNDDIKLLMAGGSENDQADLKRYATKIGVESQVEFLGYLNQKELGSLISTVDVTVSPIPPTKNYMVSSPTKVVESLGYGTPVVANSEIPDQAEVVDESRGGRLIPYDEEKFAYAIVELLSDKNVLMKLGESGRRYIHRERSYQLLATQVIRNYTNLFKNER